MNSDHPDSLRSWSHFQSLAKKLVFYICFIMSFPFATLGQVETTKHKETLSNEKTSWLKLDEDLYFGRVSLYSQDNLFDAQIYVVKFSLNKYLLRATTAKTIVNKKTTTAKDLAQDDQNIIATINANFFDENKNPLGLIVDNPGKKLSSTHQGGKLLTSIFFTKDQKAYITPRNEFPIDGVETAAQAGPQIISNSKLVDFSVNDRFSRRSGIAITKDNEIIFYATALRFPGTSLTDIQKALMSLGVDITDALNLDGGGSSQLYLRSSKLSKGEVFVSGGDEVPAFFILSYKR